MLPLLETIRSSPILVRVLPFAIFGVLTLVQDQFGDAMQYWIYAGKTIACALLLWIVRSQIKEMSWRFSWEAVVIGAAIFIAWIGLDGYYPMLVDRAESFNPIRTYGRGDTLALTFIAVRILGSSLVVPLLEEVFYRSFLYRFVSQSPFWKMPLGRFELKAFIITGVVFGISHYEWLPAILCAFAYQGLVCRKNRLDDAITAHAITNCLLSVWVVVHEDYYFW